MNLNNSKYNYARKFKAILKYVLFAVPLIMVLVAVLFPIKTSTNTYDGSVVTIDDDSYSSIMFNQSITSDLSSGSKTTTVSYQTAYLWSNPSYFESGHIIYASCYLYNDDGVSVAFGFTPSNISYGGKVVSQATDYTRVSFLYETDDSYDRNLRIVPYTATTVYWKEVQFIDLTYMYGSGNEPSLTTFEETFPLDYYGYYEPTLLMEYRYTSTTTVNDTDLIWYTEESKSLNTTLLTPMVDFYDADINSWYESFLTAFELDYDTSSYMYYLVHMPLWIMYVVLLDLILDIVLLVPCLLHRLVYKYKGDE